MRSEFRTPFVSVVGSDSLGSRVQDQPGAVLPRGISMAVGSFVSILPKFSATFQAQLLNRDGGTPLAQLRCDRYRVRRKFRQFGARHSTP